MTWKELKEKLDTLTEEQLAQKAIIFCGEEEIGSEIDSWEEQSDDVYWHDGDCYGFKEGAEEAVKEDDSLSIEDFTIVPKGYFTLNYTPSETLIMQRHSKQ